MVLRQPMWDKYETALLIEAYWIIKADSSKKRTVVASLSSFLRKRATYVIDDTFRNENGINMRLGELDFLFSKGNKGLYKTSALFREMVEMYLHDRNEFEMVLLEAKGMSANTNNVRTRFCNWLKEKSPKVKPETVCQMLAIGEEFCKKTKVLTASIFETTDVDAVKQFTKTVTSNKIFRIRNKKLHPAIVNAANLYYSFVRNLPELEQMCEEDGQETCKARIDRDADQIADGSSERDSDQTSYHEDGSESENSILIVDFRRLGDFAHTKPINAQYFGEKISTPKSWKALYVDVIKALQADYPQVFNDSLVLGNRKGSEFGDSSSSHMISPVEIIDGFYAETNYSATDLIKRIRKLLNLCFVDYDNLIISYIKNTQTSTTPQTHHPSNDDSIEWVLSALQSNRIEYCDNRYLGGCLWVVGGNELITFIKECSRHGYRFTFKPDGCKSFPNKAVWWTKDSVNKESPLDIALATANHSSVTDQAFFVYLREELQMAESTCRSYTSAIRIAESYAQDHGFMPYKIFGSDTTTAYNIIQALLADPGFSSYNQRQHNRFSAGFAKLIVFLGVNQQISSRASTETASNDAAGTQQESHTPVENTKQIVQAEAYVLEADLNGITIEELSQMINESVLGTRRIVQSSMNIVTVYDRLLHKQAFMDWDEGADQLEAILDKLMERNDGYVSYTQLFEYARVEMELFLNDNDMNDARKVFDLAEHLFSKEAYHGKKYIFTGKTHISRVGESIDSKLDIVKKYARDHDGFFSESELEAYLQSLGVKIGSLRQQMRLYDKPTFIFYNPGEYVFTECLSINESWISQVRNAIQKLFYDVGDHIILRDIQFWWYSLLPSLPGSRPWTPLFLQGILTHYGKEVGAKTIPAMAGQATDTLHAMVTDLSSPLRTFSDAVIAILLDQNIQQRDFDAEELRRLLVSWGLITGNELIWNMPKALPSDEHFVWGAEGNHVSIKI